MESASDYAIETDAFGNEAQGNGQQGNSDVDPVTQRRRMEVIKDILDNFDLEATLDRYRTCDNQYSLDVNNLSLDSALAGSRVKDRLEYLMGSDVVKVNDKKYSDRLQKRLQEEYDIVLKQREMKLQQGEERRVHRLVLEGIIHSSDEEDGACLHEHKHSRRKTKSAPTRKRRKRSTHKERPVRQVNKSADAVERTVPSGTCEETSSRLPISSDDETAVYLYKEKDDSYEDSWGGGTDSKSSKPMSEASSKSSDDAGNASSMYVVSSSANKHHDPIIRRLHEEETIDGLYRLANILVTPRSAKS